MNRKKEFGFSIEKPILEFKSLANQNFITQISVSKDPLKGAYQVQMNLKNNTKTQKYIDEISVLD